MTDQTLHCGILTLCCGWCYGARHRRQRPLGKVPEVELRLLLNGLFAAGAGASRWTIGFAAYAWSNDQRIERPTGRPAFSDNATASR